MITKEMKDLQIRFVDHFGSGTGLRYFFAPGRVNLIGEHIDYNGGFVFPAALSIGITALVRPNDSDTINMISLNIPGEVKVDLNGKILYKKDDWGNHPRGVFSYLKKEGYKLRGCDILYSSSLPDGAGLSSSAAIEVLTAYMMLELAGEKIDRKWIAKFCQVVENEFIKVNCGIMDQFSIAMGKENSAILLNCNTMTYSYVPLNLKDYSLVIMNTNKKRELADSKYNERRQECDEALRIINLHEEVKYLCDATLVQVNKYVKDEVLKRRALHVVTENNRVIEAVDSLKAEDINKFASLLSESHYSLKHNYEVTGFELDTIVSEAVKIRGCIGARMTGAGFGGCAIAIVERDKVNNFIDSVSKAYKEKTNLIPDFYDTNVSMGVKEFTIQELVKKTI